MRRYRNVPPLQFLLGFEAAARLGSFSKAAIELGLSQSAVSHEIRLLEERIGQPLFLRVGRSVQLTDAGRVYQRSVREALDGLDGAQAKLEPFRRPTSVVIYTPRDFGRLWLMPRLGLLQKACPDVEPWLDTSGASIDFASMEISIGIIYADAAPADLLSIHLVSDIRVPMASPTFANNKDYDLGQLSKQTLIHEENSPDWADFFEAHEHKMGLSLGTLTLSDSDMALHAAVYGHGIVLGSVSLATTFIASDALIPVSALYFNTGRSWYAVTTARELANHHTASVWHWLEQTAEGSSLI